MFVGSSARWHSCLDVARSIVMKFKTPYEQGKCDCHYRRYDRDRACWNEKERIEYDKGWEYGQKLNYYYDDFEYYDKDELL
jgi:hypothetical protein